MLAGVLAFTVGTFLVLARFRFFWDPSAPAGSRWLNADRYSSLKAKLEFCGVRAASDMWTWYVALLEVVGGALFAVNIARPIVGPLILGMLLVATRCTACIKVAEQNPVDRLDMCCAYLWRVEGLYILMTGLVVWEDWKWTVTG